MQPLSPRMPPKVSSPSGAGGDAATEPEDAPKGFQPNRGQEGMQPLSPRMPPKVSSPSDAGGDAANEPEDAPKRLPFTGGRRGCSQ